MNEITRFVCIHCNKTNDISPFANDFIQKGKLEQKKEDIKIIDKTLIKLANVLHPSNQDYDWYKIIYDELKKQLQKEIGEEKGK